VQSPTIASYYEYEKAVSIIARSPTAVQYEKLHGIVNYNDPNPEAKGSMWLLVAEKNTRLRHGRSRS